MAKKGFDFNAAASPDESPFTFSPQHVASMKVSEAGSNPFIFGDTSARSETSKVPSKREKKEGKLPPLPKWTKSEITKV